MLRSFLLACCLLAAPLARAAQVDTLAVPSPAMNKTYRAVTQAGFNSTTFPKLADTMFITEPEAAAVYASRYFDDLDEQFLTVRRNMQLSL